MRSVLEPVPHAARCWPLYPGPDRLEMEERGRGGKGGGRESGGEGEEGRGEGERGRGGRVEERERGGEWRRGGEGEWRRGGNMSKGTGERTEW